jgi:hypothetical protein
MEIAMTSLVHRLLSAEAALFGAAALTHTGLLTEGHQHSKAATAESVIALVLIAGLIGTFLGPSSTRTIALGVQGFALLGTLVGIFTIAIGIGPRTALDLVIHACMIALLAFGSLTVARAAVNA